MKFSAVLVVLVLVGCSAWPFSGDDNEDDFRVPLVCGPEHNKLPCTAGVEEGVGYRFNLLTHCGIEWAYFDGRYWVPMPMLDAPSHWAGIEAGTIVLKQPSVAIFEADEGGGARFVPAPRSYRPPDCEESRSFRFASLFDVRARCSGRVVIPRPWRTDVLD